MILGNNCWVDIEKADKNRVVVVPLGSLEQHGHHLPLLTDTYLVTSVADRVEVELAGSEIASHVDRTRRRLGILLAHQHENRLRIFLGVGTGPEKIVHDIAGGFRACAQTIDAPAMDHVVANIKVPRVMQLGITLVIIEKQVVMQ